MIYDSIVIGGGPAGLACSIELKKLNKQVLLLERESRLGGILKQCIHDGFGLTRFNERLTGPEYANRFIQEVIDLNVEYKTNAFVTNAVKDPETNIFHLDVVTEDGIIELETKTLVLSTGCRERTGKQIYLQGTRPYGVMTAGQAQALININGVIPGTKACILGSGDIGLIMARRLTLSGVKVQGVYEVKDSPSGLNRNIYQCLNDYNIPLHLSTTVKQVYGDDRLTGIDVQEVDNHMDWIDHTMRHIDCDLLILSVGLIPENELAEKLGVTKDRYTNGPSCDNGFETNVQGIYTCGNATNVNDLVDYVSESGEVCARSIAYALDNNYINSNVVKIPISMFGIVQSMVPQYINYSSERNKVNFYFRPKYAIKRKAKISIIVDGRTIYQDIRRGLTPTEMQTIHGVDFTSMRVTSNITFRIDEVKEIL